MANIIVIAGLGAAMAAGAITQLVKAEDTARVPAWFETPARVAISNVSGTPERGRFELSFEGASDSELRAVQSRLAEKGFTLATKPSASGGVSRTFVARDSGAARRIEIDLTEMPDHDVWRVSYFDSRQG